MGSLLSASLSSDNRDAVEDEVVSGSAIVESGERAAASEAAEAADEGEVSSDTPVWRRDSGPATESRRLTDVAATSS